MPTILKCTCCGSDVLRKEVILGHAKELDNNQCVCARCLPGYEAPENLSEKTKRKRYVFLAIAIGSAALIAIAIAVTAVLIVLCNSSIPQERTILKKPAMQETFVTVMKNLPEEMNKSGSNATPIPVRFPVGARGARIESYAQMAAEEKVAEISALLNKGKDDPAVLREILSGISRSEQAVFVSMVRPFLSHANPEIRALAVLAFGKIAGVDDLPDIRALLEDKHPSVRAAAQMAISAVESSK